MSHAETQEFHVQILPTKLLILMWRQWLPIGGHEKEEVEAALR
jgi:hypothetical protein